MGARDDTAEGAGLLTGMALRAVRLADRAVVHDIESQGERMAGDVWDLTAMFDDREHGAEHIDLAMESMGYALARGLVEIIRRVPLQVRILRRP
jgi:hypothetical protein